MQHDERGISLRNESVSEQMHRSDDSDTSPPHPGSQCSVQTLALIANINKRQVGVLGPLFTLLSISGSPPRPLIQQQLNLATAQK
jgi:hypothetical protein